MGDLNSYIKVAEAVFLLCKIVITILQRKIAITMRKKRFHIYEH